MSVTRFPLHRKKYYREYRRVFVPRFPYGVFYRVDKDFISIVAVIKLVRAQRTIRRELREAEGDI